MQTGKPKVEEILGGLEHRTTYRFSMIAALHSRAFSTVYSKRYRLNVNAWKVLSVVGRFGPMSANSTGEHSSLEPDKVTRAVDALVKQGLVLRRQDPHDRRRVVLSRSVTGRRVHDELSQLRKPAAAPATTAKGRGKKATAAGGRTSPSQPPSHPRA